MRKQEWLHVRLVVVVNLRLAFERSELSRRTREKITYNQQRSVVVLQLSLHFSPAYPVARFLCICLVWERCGMSP